jgi:hypothetical protein
MLEVIIVMLGIIGLVGMLVMIKVTDGILEDYEEARRLEDEAFVPSELFKVGRV